MSNWTSGFGNPLGIQRDPIMPTSSALRDERERHANAARLAPRIPWDEFVNRLKWRSGQHIALIGPTGQGKTTVMQNLLPLRPYVVVFATKPRDSSMDRLIDSGYLKMERWVSLPAEDAPRRVLWPDASDLDNMVPLQQRVFSDALRKIYKEGGWCVAIDELWWVIEELKMDRQIKGFLTQGRALGISVLTATQRPVDVPLAVYNQSTHLLIWRTNDKRDLDRLSDFNTTVPAYVLRSLVAHLEEFQLLYLNTRDGTMYRTRAPHPNGGTK